ncbi:MAG: sorbosone dehydrogenase family protein, partial [Kordiimonadaceae bacterium]|nr:sorbosone dehydrogenase family protein [Kordiimonadaceae bacterium]
MYKNILASLTLLALTMTAPHIQSQEVDKLILPDGFSIEIYANVRNARQMSLGDDGTVYVGTRSRAGGRIFAIPDANRDGKADEVITITSGL